MKPTRRAYPRCHVALDVRVTEASGKSWTAEAEDLSPFGMRVRNGHGRRDSVVRLDFDLPRGGTHVTVKALAVRTEPDGVAFAFVDVDRAEFCLVRQAVDDLLLRRKLWIMIIEDDREVASVLADYVEREGHAALIIARAEDALAYLSHDRPDAILLDLGLPGMGGVEFLEVLARREIRIPVVVMCGTASEADAARCLQLGALDVAAQPHGHQFELAVSALGLKGLEERLAEVGPAHL